MHVIPSPTADKPDLSIFERRESRVRSYCRAFPRKFARAAGSWLFDESGAAYLDFLAGCSTLNYGHNNPVLKEALIDYIADDGVAHSLDMHTSAKEDFLTAFEEKILTPRGLDYKVMFPGPTGANAVEAALKLARKVTGRTNVIAFTNGFHGMTLGALAATANAGKRGGAGIELTGVTRMPFDNYFGDGVDTAEQLDKMLSDPSGGIDAPAAVLVETVQGEGGLNAASFEWLKKIAAIAKRHGALFIVDDIQAGVGRTGSFFSFEPAGLKPDIVTLAKSLSGMGLPFALTLMRPEYDIFAPGEHNGTFRGNCHAFVTATAAIDRFWSDDVFEKEVKAKGELLRDRLKRIASKYPSSAARVKGRGMMQGIDLKSGDIAQAACKAAFKRGVVIETSGGDDEVVKVLAPLTIERSDLEKGLDLVAEAIDEAMTKSVCAAAE